MAIPFPSSNTLASRAKSHRPRVACVVATSRNTMPKKVYYTQVTPLPKTIPRQLALDLLHSHEELIRLNPLVTAVEAIAAPRDARNDEYYSEWYLIHETMNWGPGMKKKMSFKGVFHDQSWGLQSHTYAPLGTDLRQKYRIGGSQPGEPPEARELGIETPSEGLYLREDHEISCAVPMTAGFVKKEMKAATSIMVERLTKKAELLEQGKLHAMFEQGRLRTTKPNLAGAFLGAAGGGSGMSIAPSSPAPVPSVMHRESQFLASPSSPSGDGSGTFGLYSNIAQNRHASMYAATTPSLGPDTTTTSTAGDSMTTSTAGYVNSKPLPQHPVQGYSELPASMGQLAPPTSQPGFRAELPGDIGQYPPQHSQQPDHPEQHRASMPAAYNPAIFQHASADMPSPLRIGQRRPSATGDASAYHIVNTDAAPLPTKSNPDLRAAGSWSQLAATGSESYAQRFSRLSISEQPGNDGPAAQSTFQQQTTTPPPQQQQQQRQQEQSHDYPQQPQRQHPPSLVPQPGPQDHRCPACPFFGDEAAVNHHYLSSHLT